MNKIGDKLFNIYCYLEYVPIVSSIVGIINLIVKKAFIATTPTPEILKSKYFTHIKEQSTTRCALTIVPIIGNVYAAVHDQSRKQYDDPNFVLQLNVEDFPKASFRLRNDRDFLLRALAEKPMIYTQLDSSLKNDAGIMNAMFAKDSYLLPHLPRSFILSKLREDGTNYYTLDADQRNDRELLVEAMGQNLTVVKFTVVKPEVIFELMDHFAHLRKAELEKENKPLPLIQQEVLQVHETIFNKAPSYFTVSFWDVRLFPRYDPNNPLYRNPLYCRHTALQRKELINEFPEALRKDLFADRAFMKKYFTEFYKGSSIPYFREHIIPHLSEDFLQEVSVEMKAAERAAREAAERAAASDAAARAAREAAERAAANEAAAKAAKDAAEKAPPGEKAWEILGIPQTASIDDINKAWRKKTFNLHPDRSKDPHSGEKIKVLNEAREAMLKIRGVDLSPPSLER